MNTNTMSYVRSLNRRNFTNNTQRVLHSLLMTENSDGWVSRSSIRGVSSVAARIRDLRKEEFGSFTVECRTASDLNRKTRNPRATFYRIKPESLTLTRVRKVLGEGVVSASKSR